MPKPTPQVCELTLDSWRDVAQFLEPADALRNRDLLEFLQTLPTQDAMVRNQVKAVCAPMSELPRRAGDGTTPLHLGAVVPDNLPCLHLVGSRLGPADFSRVDASGCSALDLAVQLGHAQTAVFLMERGAAYTGYGRGEGDNAWRSRAPGPHAHGNAARQVVDGLRTEVWGRQKKSNDPRNNQHNPNTPITGRPWRANGTSRHIQHSPGTQTAGLRDRGNDTQQEHRPQRPTESSDPTQRAKGRTGDCPGPRKETATRRNVTQGGLGNLIADVCWAGHQRARTILCPCALLWAVSPSASVHHEGHCSLLLKRKRHQRECGRQKAATRRNMRREERVTVQGPVKKQQPDGMSHRGGGELQGHDLLLLLSTSGTSGT